MNLQKYFEFIKKCKNNNPEKYHTHHIIPRYMRGSNNESNLIKLSYEDHYIAHIILAECFEPGSYHYNRNIWSALKLSGWKNDSELSEKLSLARNGKTYEEIFGEEVAKKAKEKLSKHWRDYWNQPENKERKKIFMTEHNPMKTLKFSDISIKKMSDARKHWWDEISDEDLFTLKEKRSMISKKWWSNLSIDERLNISEKTSISMKKWWSSVNNEIIQARNKKISDSQRGVAKNPESVEKRKINVKENNTFSGEKNPMFGKKHSDETIEKIRQKSIGRSGNRLGKAFSSFKFYCDDVFIYEAFGQIDARNFCKEHNINFQTLCKESDKWNNWYCERNKKQNE
jgi:hypothetical protein